jgi:cytochrome b561
MHYKNSQQSWGWMSLLIHWLSAVVIVGLFVLGLWMVELTYYDSWYHKAPNSHKSIGILLFILTCWRLLWMAMNLKPVPLMSHTRTEQKLAKITHRLLYFLLLAVMISGYLISTADGRALEVFSWFEVPAIIYGFAGQEDIAGSIHLILAYGLILLAIIHTLAAVKHHLIDKDATLKRIFGG